MGAHLKPPTYLTTSLERYQQLMPRPRGAKRTLPKIEKSDHGGYQPQTRNQGLRPLAEVDLSHREKHRGDNQQWLSSLLGDIGQSHKPRRLELPPMSKSVSLNDLTKIKGSNRHGGKLRLPNRSESIKYKKPKTDKPAQLQSLGLEDFTIKQKLREFWRWHEEYKRKVELSNNRQEYGVSERTRNLASLEQNVFYRHQQPIETQTADDKHNEMHGAHPIATGQGDKEPIRAESPAAKLLDPLLYREHTQMTWKTWRNKNDSYAYDNVDEYIIDNQLMPDDKRAVIDRWIDSVQCTIQAHENRPN